MKILALHICNLNSLVGTHKIDFRVEPLSSAGLYAIVGPTGAGKSTVLDAITLALYGRTERDPYGAEIMSHGTGECFAEVIFETPTGSFLSRWERRRARQRPDGNLQTASLQLSRYDHRKGEFKPLPADRLNEVRELIRETIGLDYDQFVRSVMLTQGQFARFLASSTKERADILEKITGTGIYSLISQRAFDRHKVAREDYERLRESQRHLLPLPDEERAILLQRLDEAKQGIERCRPQIDQLREQINHYKELDRLKQRHNEIETALRRIEARAQNLQAHRTALDASQALHPLREPLRELANAKVEADKTGEQLRAQSAQREDAARSLAAAEAEAQRKTALLNDWLGGKAKRMADLEAAAVLESQLIVLKREATTDAPELDEAQRRVDNLHGEVTDLSMREATIREKLQGQNPAEVTEEFQRLQQQFAEAGERRSHLLQWESRLRVEEDLAGVTAAEKETLQRLQAARDTLAKAAAQLVAVTEREAGRKRIVERLEQSRGLEPLRSDLAEGEPCPLCGATHHPALTEEHVLTDEDLRLARADLRSAQESVVAATAAERQLATEVTRLATQYSEQGKRRSQLADELATAEPESARPTADSTGVRRQLRELEITREPMRERITALQTLQSATDELQLLAPELHSARERLLETRGQLQKLIDRNTKRDEALLRLKGELGRLIKEDSVAAARRQFEERENELRTQAQAYGRKHDEAIATLRTATALEKDRRDLLSRLQAEQHAIRQTLQELLGRHNVGSIEEARERLLSPEREESYRAQLREVDLDLRSRRDAYEEIGVQLTAARARVSNMPEVDQLKSELAALEESVDALHRERGSLGKEIQTDDERRFAYGLLTEQLGAAETDLHRWARLNDLIGQKDGVKFSRFAQTLTLQRLVAVGNRHLRRINERYRMRHRPAEDLGRESLELEIIDTFQNDNRRPMATLSGGETFIVSLALALGLSDLASGRTNIQSLFIDEGFGTLDEKILDDAISALEQLQGQGKTIGLISHVRELRERIHCQIRLQPRGGGRSQLTVVPIAAS